MSSICKLNNGKWKAQVRTQGISKSKTFLTKQEAKFWADELEKLILRDTGDEKPYYTLEEAIDRYLREVTIKKGSFQSEKIRLFRFMREFPEISQMYLTDITRRDLDRWQSIRAEQVSNATVMRERTSLSAVLSKCVQWEYMRENPFKFVDKLKRPPPRTRRISQSEINALIEASGYNIEGENAQQMARVGGALLFAIETAMRAGEIFNLTWENVNLELRTVYLPKTKNGHPRTVPLSKKATAILENLRAFHKGKENVFNFTNQSTMEALFRKIKAKANLDKADLHFHDSRREALSRLAPKFDVMELAKISGHRDVSILLNTYYAPNVADFVHRLD